jgi:diguanylate cyclase (GGDEF)-like protein/PAS domain S-box-containing protein
MWAVDDDEAASHEMSRLHEQLLERLTEAIPIGLFQFDHAGRITFVNDRLQSWLGGAPPATLADVATSLTDRDRAVFTAHIASVLAGSALDDEEVHIAADGRVCTLSLRSLCDPDGRVNGGVGCLSDVTERVRLRGELELRATTDQLTGAANRAASFAALQDWLDADLAVTVAFVDLDDFKSINDHHGHAAGDDALVALAARLRAVCREDDLVGRLGGDEFVVVSRGTADALAERIAEALAEPIEVVGGRVQLRASIGLATGTRRSDTADTLLDRADAAMYADKGTRSADTAPIAGRTSPARQARSDAHHDGRADIAG